MLITAKLDRPMQIITSIYIKGMAMAPATLNTGTIKRKTLQISVKRTAVR